jgi:hypothetical protein
MIRMIRRTVLLALFGALVACGNAAPAAQSPPAAAPAGGQPTAPSLPTTAPTIARPAGATALPAATLPVVVATAAAPEPTAASGALPEGLTPEGYHFLGRADAPATLVMYSDFL